MTLPGICYCDSSDTMSRCVAKKEYEYCMYFDKSMCGNRCMYFIMDEYCDCWQASRFYTRFGVITRQQFEESRDSRTPEPELRRVEETEIDLVATANRFHRAYPKRACDNCKDYNQCPVDPHQYPAGIQQQLAVKCHNYCRK